MPNRKLLFNAGLIYGRSLVGLILGLISTRWVLGALGVSDFGVYSLVGSLIILSVSISGLMANSVARSYAFALGEGIRQDLNSYFFNALIVHFIIGCLVLFFGWIGGEYIIKNMINISQNRVEIAVLIYKISLLSSFFTITAVPFIAMFVARQDFLIVASWGVLQSVLNFLAAWILLKQDSNLLLIYAICMAVSSFLINIFQAAHAYYKYNECRIFKTNKFDFKKIKILLSFASWNLFGWIGVLFRDQGSLLLVNSYFGVRANAAYAIGNQVSAQANQLSTSVITAFTPAVTTLAGAKDYVKMQEVSSYANKIGVFFNLFIGLPIIFEIDFILNLWLVSPPNYAAYFCKYILIAFMIDRLTAGQMMMVYASGKIAGYQISIGIVSVLSVLIGWILYEADQPLGIIVWCIIGVAILIGVLRIYWAKILLNSSVSVFIFEVFIPISLVTVAGISAALLVLNSMDQSLSRFFAMTASINSVVIFFGWCLLLNKNQKSDVKLKIKLLSRFK